MSRVPYAARTLFKQLQERYKNPTMTPVGEPDGFNVHRSVALDKTSSKWLAEKVTLETLDDPRIVDWKMSRGILVLTFAGRPIADQRQRFPLDAAETITASLKNEPEPDPVSVGDPGDDSDS